MAAKKKAKSEAGKTARVTASVRFEPGLHRRATIYAYDRGTTFQAVVNAGLDEYLKKNGA